MADTFWTGTAKLFLQSGNFTSTLKTSEDVSGVDATPTGISWDGTNTPWSGSTADKLYLQSGQFTSTLKTSEDVSASDTLVGDISWSVTDTPWVGDSSNKLYLQSGQFTSTIKTSQFVGSVDGQARGISWDGTNTPWTGDSRNRLYLQSGQFTSTLKTSQPAAEAAPRGVSWDGTDTPWCGIGGQKLYLQSGQFTSTLKTSESVSAYAAPEGIEFSDFLPSTPTVVTISANATASVSLSVILNSTVAISATASLSVDRSSTSVSIVCSATATNTLFNTVAISATANLGVVATGISTVPIAISCTATLLEDLQVLNFVTPALSATATIGVDLTRRRVSTSVAQAFVSVDISVTMNATNPTLSGDLVDIGNNAVFQLTVNGDLLDFTQVTSCFHAWNMLDLEVSYDGKDLSFQEFTGIGSATYSPEQDVTLEIDFGNGLGLTRLFTGKIKQRDHEGRNNNESVSYTAVDYLQLADDLTAINSDGYPQIQWTAPTTVTTITSAFGTFVGSSFIGGNLALQELAPKPIKEAIQDLFSFNSAQLTAAGIPTAIGAPGLEQFTADLPETVTVDAQGFSQALISVASYQKGVKVLFNEKQQAWTFPNLLTVPTVIVDVASTNIPELPFSVDTTDRYTAVCLYADIVDENSLDDTLRDKSEIVSLGGPLGFGKIERSEVTMQPQWLKSLETNWNLFAGLYSDPRQIEGQNYFVYRRYAIPEGTERPGFGLEAHAYAKYNVWGNVFWQIVEGVVLWNQGVFMAAHPIIARGNVYHPGNAFPADEVKLAFVPSAISYYPATAIGSDGNVSYTATATSVGRPEFADKIRVPATGYEGTASTDFGISREWVEIVDRTQVTTENARALLDIRKDAVITGEIPIEGDPIPQLIGLGVKCLVQHPTRSTGIESFPAFVTQYSYEFSKRGQSSISLSTDISGLIS